ncbi:flavin reductase family protein [Methylocapsa sp. S129]|uniref:flavin reductase family protein n=1 Tax=Methylocapsa sp. S129 TaxID=1641869 RepID=UPI00131D0A25|nr:flavin reductase family protein [Methylocapsa sp. S129]
MRSFDFESMTAEACYRLMVSSIVPRPIAWVVSRSGAGVLNAAPYSFFNMMGSEPPILAIGALPGRIGHKDTVANVMETGEFVVNLVPDKMKEAMNATCIDAPPEIDELAHAGIETTRSTKVGPPRVRDSPVAFECRTLQLIETGPCQTLILGQVVMAHFAEAVLIVGDRPRVQTEAMNLIGRMHGADMYVRTTDLFSMPRPVWPASSAR